jgi:hypothetical protein
VTAVLHRRPHRLSHLFQLDFTDRKYNCATRIIEWDVDCGLTTKISRHLHRHLCGTRLIDIL